MFLAFSVGRPVYILMLSELVFPVPASLRYAVC